MAIAPYLYAFFAALTLSYGGGIIVRHWALSRQVVDDPAHDTWRRVHNAPVPLLGGIAVCLAILLPVAWFTVVNPLLLTQFIAPQFLIGTVAGAFIILAGGYWDDRWDLPLWGKFAIPIVAALVVVVSDVGVNFITNPFGGVFRIDQWKLASWQWGSFIYTPTLPADLFTVVWLVALMYTTKLLDGIDGAVAGVSAIGAIIIFFLSLSAVVLQFDTALFALIIAGAFLGFLGHNWSPARLFLGESGSLLGGYLLGVLAIIAGGKMATTLLVLSVPLFDVAWVVVRRMLWEGRWPWEADRQHLHHRLLDLGWSTKQVVLALYTLAVFGGLLALSLQSRYKFYALAAALMLALVAAGILTWNRAGSGKWSPHRDREISNS